MKSMKNTLYRIVARDITEEINKQYKPEERCTYRGKEKDVWVYGFHRVFTKESRELNKLLGLHSINKLGNTNGF